MATQSVSSKILDNMLQNSAREQVGAPRYVARQPILDPGNRVHGYELLFWNGRDLAGNAGGEQAASAVLDTTVIYGLEHLTWGLPAFVACTPQSLTEPWVNILPPKMTVLELPADAEPTVELIALCHKLKGLGFRIALGDFKKLPETRPPASIGDMRGRPEPKSLTGLADYIKIDFRNGNAAARRALVRGLYNSTARLIADHVESPEDRKLASEEGFKLFQGYYFCRPEPVKNHRIPANRLVHLEILEDLQSDPIDLGRLSQLVMCDASLTYRLLRLVNSPVCAMRQEVTSIQSALMLVGEATFRRIAMLAIAGDFSEDQPKEILRMAFERGRFCELAAIQLGLVPSEQYLIGMVSLFPAMLRIQMEDMVKLLPLREQARQALLGEENPEGLLLHWLKCQERGDWAGCDAIVRYHGLSHELLMRLHTEAVTWAQDALKSAN